MVAMGQSTAALDRQTDLLAPPRRPRAIGRAERAAGLDAQRRQILKSTIELDVIPRLLRARGIGRVEAESARPLPVTSAHVAELVAYTLVASEAAASSFVAAMRDQGFRAEALYLDLLAPAANRLGELWVEDFCDFTEVTIGLNRLQHAMRMLSPAFLGSAFLAQADRQDGPRVLLTPQPGEQHTFGLSMVLDFFRRAGWTAWSGPIGTIDELAAMVRADWIDVVGFSLSSDERLETVRSDIRAVRRASRNPGLAVMVGGQPFVRDPGLARAVGADGTAQDGRHAVAQAEALLERVAERC